MQLSITYLSSVVFMLLIIPSGAAVLITPIGATSTTEIGATRNIGETIDNSGLSGTGASVTETHSVNSDNNGPYWLSASGDNAAEVLTFDLGATYDVDTIHQWVYTRGGETDRGLQTFDMSFSTNGGISYGATVSAASLGMANFSEPTANPLPAQTRTFTEQTGVTHIRFSNITNFGDGNFIGLSEIKFEGDLTVIPEPSSIALFALGGLGLFIRRRR
jgi:hypothetical protein